MTADRYSYTSSLPCVAYAMRPRCNTLMYLSYLSYCVDSKLQTYIYPYNVSGRCDIMAVALCTRIVAHIPQQDFIRLGVRSLANASRARQFNPLNPPGVGWVNFLR